MSTEIRSFLPFEAPTIGPSSPTGSTKEYRSLFDDSILALVRESTAMDVVKSLAPAKKALEAAENTTPTERAVWLDSIAHEIESSEMEIARSEALFEGLPVSFVLEKSVRPTIALFRNLARSLAAATDDVVRRPTGLVSIIAPGSLAFRSIGDRLGPALAAGNAVFVKVPSSSPISASLWARVLTEVPSGLVSLFVGSGRDIGSLLVSHPSIRAVTFAGSADVGGRVVATAASSGKKLQISAGVKNGLLLHSEADLANLPTILRASLIAPGRLGWSLGRIFVTEPRAEEFFARTEELLANLEPLTSPDGDSPWTPLSAGEKDRLEGHLGQARGERAKVAMGGPGPETHARPVLIRDLTNCSPLQLEELDSPALIVNTVKYAHEMAKWTNTGDYGFCASVWGPSEKVAALGKKLNVGRVWLNDWMEGPGAFAGWRKSFFGNPDFDWDGTFFSDVRPLTEAFG